MLFTAFPIVFQQERGWTPGIGGLAFVGIAIGVALALAYVVFIENPRYTKKLESEGGWLAPEQRLFTAMVGGVMLPAGLFIFAWTAVPAHIHWVAPIIGSIPFGCGMVLVFLGVLGYLVDSYLVFAASVLAGNTVVRSCFGVAFPLFTKRMFENLGIHWAGTLIACLGLLFAPSPLSVETSYLIIVLSIWVTNYPLFSAASSTSTDEGSDGTPLSVGSGTISARCSRPV